MCLGEGEGVGGEGEGERHQPGPHWQVVAVVPVQAVLQTPVGEKRREGRGGWRGEGRGEYEQSVGLYIHNVCLGCVLHKYHIIMYTMYIV